MTAPSRAAEDLLADLNDLPDDPNAHTVDAADADEASIDEFLAEFSKDRERPSRPITPRLPGSKARASPRPGAAAAGEGRSSLARKSVDASRASTDSKRSNRDETPTFTNSSAANSDKSEKNDDAESVRSETRSENPEVAASQKKVYGGGSSWSSWGGSLWSTANSLQTQIRAEAEKRLADLQASEEAQRLQARLRELDLSKLANEARNIGQGVLDAVAPPIDGNETLVVNVTHDLTGLRVERSIYSSFERVMEQVEGGSLRVVARDREGTIDLNAIPTNAGEAKKMCQAALEEVTRAGGEDAAEGMSHIFLAVQAFTVAGGEEEGEEPACQFLATLTDPSNSIAFTSLSQSFPASWVPLSLQTVDAAVQPREWISEWLEEALQLVAGVLAQRYVARRMGMDASETSAADSAREAKEGGMKVREGQDLSEAGLAL